MFKLTEKLHQSQFWLIVYASSAAFMTYFCMYAFRKPFTAATYETVTGWDFQIDFKVALVLAQVFGYLLSKIIGIKVVSEMKASQRAYCIFALVMFAQLALIIFPLVPAPYNLILLFLNGLPLGMIWGLVFSYLEGRRVSEILGAALSVTFIVASGWVRTIGKWLIVDMGVPELWMPAFTGGIFILPLLVSVVALSQLPPPSAADIALRQKRLPMNGKERWRFFCRFAPGITFLVLSFMMLTGLRDFRDNFEAEIWAALGYGQEANIFAYTGIRIAFIVLLALGAMVLIKNNVKAFYANHLVILLGICLFGLSTLMFEAGMIQGKTWMVALGAGVYIAYIPYNCFLFDRMISALGVSANAGFLIYISDSAGYLGSVGILLYRTFGSPELSWLTFFINTTYLVAIVAGTLVLASLAYFSSLLRGPSLVPEPVKAGQHI
ncbi:hypothetical protein FM037_07400 [Shewanella psychropiezotolerans]|uniref:MFS transporter n=1 Tax=Shewanella psychropiezotolerans TaxID=2593655 RepID=A0ABX5WZB6_9GAMM|nr:MULTISPECIES: DUF5690 family protein [Shewanella]MPY22612.1 hypothetical protein [Shewanella sp. YLB-07]QDO83083.1 hypothetical protein FM037_07400 [Shewanella psychropiezotolerans]